MACREVVGTARKIIFSRFFLVAMIIWILLTFLISVVSVGVISDSSVINSYSVPDSQLSAIIHTNGTAINYYGQNFNEYGVGIAGTKVYYNLSGTSQTAGGEMKHITGGYAGVTNSDGFIAFNVSSLNPAYVFSLNIHAFNSAIGYNAFPTYFISQNSSEITKDKISITPVRSTIDTGKFALHVFAVPGLRYDNATVFYQKEPYMYYANLAPQYFNYGRTVLLGTVSVSGSMNIQTPFNLNGHPYFYGVGINATTGGTLASTAFITLPTAVDEAHEASGFLWGISALIGIMLSFLSVVILMSPTPQLNWIKARKFIPRVLQGIDPKRNASAFATIMGASAIASIPIVSVTVFFSELISHTAYGYTISAGNILALSAGLLITLMMGSSYTSILVSSGIPMWIAPDSPDYRRKYAKTLLYEFPLIAGLLIFLFMNFTSAPTIGIDPVPVVLVDFIDPFGYVSIILQKLNGSLLFTQPYSFDPSAYGVSYPSIILMGILWIVLWIVLPYFLLKRSSLRNR
ncbi:hypothetical protein Thermo_01891 [Thermoplasmatales archaeon]|nr:hypothetical protein Thermo_01891 [Thermoplasmatales archaeon]